jgi:uncharacterized protein (DUF58 family)
MLDEVFIFEVESRAEERRKARAQFRQALREGKAPGLAALARARGLIVKERENSIFSDAWIPVALLIAIVGLMAGRSPALFALGFGLVLMAVVGRWWRGAALLGVTYERSFDRTHVFPGEPIQMTLTISNLKPLPLSWLQFRDTLPIAPQAKGLIAAIVGETTGRYLLDHALSIGSYERTRRAVTLAFPQRGFYEVGPVTYRSGDVFTLFTIEREHQYVDRLVVYPRVWPLEVLELPAKEIFGERRVQRSLFTDPVLTQGIRDYQPQDRFRDIHWKATARRGRMQTRVFDPTSGLSVMVFLNVATFPRHWMGFDPDLLERAVSVAASVCSFAAEQRWGIGLGANGSVPASDQPIRVPVGRAPDQLVRILEALAAVSEFATGSIELLMLRESSRLPWSATLVLVTAVVTDEMLATLVRLKQAGRRVVLISLAAEPPAAAPHDLYVYHAAASGLKFRRAADAGRSTEAALQAVPTPEPVTDGEEGQ